MNPNQLRRKSLTMAMRAFSSMRFCKSKQLKSIIYIPFLPRTSLHKPSLHDVIHKVVDHKSAVESYGRERHLHGGILWYHSAPLTEKALETAENTDADIVTNGSDEAKPKRKKLKGKRAVVRWLKFFRYKKKRDYARMTAEEKILFKLRKARKKEERLVEALKKIEPKESSETTHDPEILTPEEHFYFLKMGRKSKNYVPVGVRGIYQGVILNMHLHWKKHETLQVVVKTFTLDEVKEMAVELARLSGGIVLDVQDDRTIIMYRGKNYSQPPTEIMSPRVTLPRKKALDKSKYKEALRSVRRHIPRLEQELHLLRATAESQPDPDAETQSSEPPIVKPEEHSSIQLEASQKLRELISGNEKFTEDDNSISGSEMVSDSEDLSDIFETDCDSDDEERKEKPLYLDVFEKLPVQNDAGGEDFEEHLRRISAKSKSKSTDADFDEVDRVVLRAASLLKNKRR